MKRQKFALLGTKMVLILLGAIFTLLLSIVAVNAVIHGEAGIIEGVLVIIIGLYYAVSSPVLLALKLNKLNF